MTNVAAVVNDILHSYRLTLTIDKGLTKTGVCLVLVSLNFCFRPKSARYSNIRLQPDLTRCRTSC